MLTDPPAALDDFAPAMIHGVWCTGCRWQGGTWELVTSLRGVTHCPKCTRPCPPFFDSMPARSAVAAERARCERIARNWQPGPDQYRLADDFSPWALTAWAIADRILAGGE